MSTLIVAGATGTVLALGALEGFCLRRNRGRLGVRIHVNGTRGKSSVTRLIAGALRAAKLRTMAKTSGTTASLIMPSGEEHPLHRPGRPSIGEQLGIISEAADLRADALVIECMALQPMLQAVTELDMIRATHGVITNCREDHLDVMGPTERDVALALAGTTPRDAKLFTAERRHLDVLREACEDRGSELIAVGPDDVAAVPDAVMDGFRYSEHKENVALALALTRDLEIDDEVAISGMHASPPEPGSMTISRLDFFGRDLIFVNAFAANDPESSQAIWNDMRERFPEVSRRLLIFNCRADRAHRSWQLGTACGEWEPADRYVLIGSGTLLFADAALSAGVSAQRIDLAENLPPEDLFELLVDESGPSALLIGMGNIKGPGAPLARLFRNRSAIAAES